MDTPAKPKTRHQDRIRRKYKELKRKQRRLRKIFNRRNVIGSNDVLVDTRMGKIKVEPVPGNDGVAVKKEKNEIALGKEIEMRQDLEMFQSPEYEVVTPTYSKGQKEADTMSVTTEAFGGESNSMNSNLKQSILCDEHGNEEEGNDESGTLFSPHIVSFKSLSEKQVKESNVKQLEDNGPGDNHIESTLSRFGKEDGPTDSPMASSTNPGNLEIPQTSQEAEPTCLPVHSALVEYDEWLDNLLGTTVTGNDSKKDKKDGREKRAKKKVKFAEPAVENLSLNIEPEEFSFNNEVVSSTMTHIECPVSVNKEVDSSAIETGEYFDQSQHVQKYVVVSKIRKTTNDIEFNEEESCVTFETTESIQAFLTRTDHLHGSSNPFCTTKSVVIKPPIKEMHDKDLANFWTCVHKLFRLHGQLIWKLTLDIHESYSVTEAYKWTRQLLCNMLNLRSLKVIYKLTEPEARIFSVVDELPNLQHLESLNLENAILPPIITYCFLDKYASKLKTLETTIKNWDEELAELFKKLKSLHLTDVGSEEAIDLKRCLQSLKKNANVRDGLVSLTVGLETSLLAKKLFEMLSPFKGLRELKLILGGSIQNVQTPCVEFEERSAETVKTKNVSLPSILTLTFSMSISQRSFGFLKWLPSLESLHLEQVSPLNYGLVREETVHEIDVELRKCLARNSAVKSRIWILLPKVKLISVSWACGAFETVRETTLFRRELCK